MKDVDEQTATINSLNSEEIDDFFEKKTNINGILRSEPGVMAAARLAGVSKAKVSNHNCYNMWFGDQVQ